MEYARLLVADDEDVVVQLSEGDDRRSGLGREEKQREDDECLLHAGQISRVHQRPCGLWATWAEAFLAALHLDGRSRSTTHRGR